MKKGFTLIELLVVIVIIGILATLATVALSSARMKARDARRVSDVKQIMTSLEMYYNEVGGYPTTVGSSISAAGNTFMQKVPGNPQPVDGAACAGSPDTYTYNHAGTIGSNGYYPDYTIDYCLGGQTGVIPSGPQTASPAGIY